MYKRYGFSENDFPNFSNFATRDLETIRRSLQKRMLEVEKNTQDLLVLTKIYESAITEKQKREGRKINKELQILGDEEHAIRVAKIHIDNVIIKRKRKSSSISSKALNHGGVYTDIHFKPPKVGEGFRGLRGVCL